MYILVANARVNMEVIKKKKNLSYAQIVRKNKIVTTIECWERFIKGEILMMLLYNDKFWKDFK